MKAIAMLFVSTLVVFAFIGIGFSVERTAVSSGRDGGVTVSIPGMEEDGSTGDDRASAFDGEAERSGTENPAYTYYGSQAGYLSTGFDNAFFGVRAGEKNTGNSNTFIGDSSALGHNTGSGNTFVGSAAGLFSINGRNTFVGYWAGHGRSSADPLTGMYNSFFGYQAGSYNTSGQYNTFLGYNAGRYNATAHSNTSVGYEAGLSNTTGSPNTFMGYCAGSGTTGDHNSFLGAEAGRYSTTGDYNAFFGNHAGRGGDPSTGGTENTGSRNAFFGNYAGEHNTTGRRNSLVGNYAGGSNTTGDRNTFIGYRAGYGNQEGSHNTIVGTYAGRYNVSGEDNVFLGYHAGYYETGSNKLYIANSTDSSPLIYGEFDNNLIRINGNFRAVASATSSDLRWKKNIHPLESSLDKVLALRGVMYEWKVKEYSDRGLREGKHIGLIAQDVEPVLPELVETDKEGYKLVSYSKLTAVLVEAVKELNTENQNQKKLIENQRDQFEKQLEKQRNQFRKQQAEIEQLRSMINALKG